MECETAPQRRVGVTIKAPRKPDVVQQLLAYEWAQDGYWIGRDEPILLPESGEYEIACLAGCDLEVEVTDVLASGEHRAGPLLAFRAGDELVVSAPDAPQVLGCRDLGAADDSLCT